MKVSKGQSGQVLLVIILLSAVLLTVGLSISQITTQESKIAKLEAEAKKALAAAEAGIDVALRQGTVADFSTLNLGADISGTATVDMTGKAVFVSPLLKKDEQYTFYLDKYENSAFSATAADFFSGNITFYLKSGTACPALELTLISSTNAVTRKLIDPCTQVSGGVADLTATSTGSPFNFQGTNFDYKTTTLLNIAGNMKLLLIRTLFADTRVGLESAVTFPAQGKTVTSTAKTTAGVARSIQLFQSYPQIPADFFVTSF